MIGLREKTRVIAVGRPMVDIKVKEKDILGNLPTSFSDIETFLQLHPKTTVAPAGSISNALLAYSKISPSTHIKVFSCVGNDAMGSLYRKQTSRKIGKPQIKDGSTDLWITAIDPETGLGKGVNILGVGNMLDLVPKEQVKKEQSLFITDMVSCKDPHLLEQIEKTIHHIQDSQAFFCLSLCGTQGLSQKDFLAIIQSFPKQPDFIFGNETEFSLISGGMSPKQAIQQVFPTSQLVVLTQRDKGSLVRFGNSVIGIDAYPTSHIVDDTGAGDNFMGTMLGKLFSKEYSLWETQHITNAANVAAFAATQVIENSNSRLTKRQGRNIRRYAKHYK